MLLAVVSPGVDASAHVGDVSFGFRIVASRTETVLNAHKSLCDFFSDVKFPELEIRVHFGIIHFVKVGLRSCDRFLKHIFLTFWTKRSSMRTTLFVSHAANSLSLLRYAESHAW